VWNNFFSLLLRDGCLMIRYYCHKICRYAYCQDSRCSGGSKRGKVWNSLCYLLLLDGWSERLESLIVSLKCAYCQERRIQLFSYELRWIQESRQVLKSLCSLVLIDIWVEFETM
jgi:hypothetical protein